MYQEPIEKLTDKTMDYIRASQSLREELEAVEWYQSRVDATQDPVLKKILGHNRDEEKEHAAMLLEYLRRHDQILEHELKDNLFSQKELGQHD